MLALARGALQSANVANNGVVFITQGTKGSHGTRPKLTVMSKLPVVGVEISQVASPMCLWSPKPRRRLAVAASESAAVVRPACCRARSWQSDNVNLANNRLHGDIWERPVQLGRPYPFAKCWQENKRSYSSGHAAARLPDSWNMDGRQRQASTQIKAGGLTRLKLAGDGSPGCPKQPPCPA